MVGYLLFTDPILRSGDEMMSFLFAVALNVFMGFGLVAMSIFGYPALFQRRGELSCDGDSLSLDAWGFLGAPIRQSFLLADSFSTELATIGRGRLSAVTVLTLRQGDRTILVCKDNDASRAPSTGASLSVFSRKARATWASGVWLDDASFDELLALLPPVPPTP